MWLLIPYVLFAALVVVLWTTTVTKEKSLFPSREIGDEEGGEEDGSLDGGFERASGIVEFEKVAAVGHHNWPWDQQGVVVALLPSGKVALVSNEPARTDVPESENVINMFVLEHNRHWNFRETVFTCPRKFTYSKFKVSGDGKSLAVGCGDYAKHSIVRVLHFQENERTWSLDPLSFDDVGFRVDISHDGRTIAIGSPFSGKGKVQVAHKTSNGFWGRSELIPLDLEDFERFGSNIAISGDGNTVAATATAPYRTTVALLFQRTAFGSWQQQGSKLGKGAPSFNKYSLASLALSSNGQTLVLAGGGLANSSEENVLVFDRTIAGEWFEHGSLVPYDNVGYAKLGAAMSMSRNGDLILTCGPDDNDTKGACWVFARRNKNSQFIQQGAKYQVSHDEHCGDPCIGYWFGRSANMLADASAFIIGGLEHPDDCNDNYGSGCLGGGAIIYHRSSGRTELALD